ncbi:TPA: hypothetical protein I7179_22050 [Vibrio vulnificus]|nr:hypothetical protein [Vibrio vulnificus]
MESTSKKKLNGASVLFFGLGAVLFVANLYVSVLGIDVSKASGAILSFGWMVMLAFGFVALFSNNESDKSLVSSSLGTDTNMELSGSNSIDSVSRAVAGDPVSMSLHNFD